MNLIDTGADASAIVVENVVKRYRSVQALGGISFNVRRGEVFGLLGPNGAGKTTTLRILTGRSRPTEGRALVAGFDVVLQREDAVRQVNVVFEDPNVYERVSGRRNLRYFADLYGLPASRVDEVLEVVGLHTAASRQARTYSTGMRQRLLIARALLNSPRILFLDEPTRGLDPLSIRELRVLMAQLTAGGTTIVLATHELDEADRLCDRVAFLRDGRLVAMATPQALKLEGGERTAAVLLDHAQEERVRLDDASDAAQLARWMSEGRVRAIHSREATLEEVFVELAHSPAADYAPPANQPDADPRHTPRAARPRNSDVKTQPIDRLRRWARVVGCLVREELRGTVRNGQWLMLVLLAVLAGSCGTLRSIGDRGVVRVAYVGDASAELPKRIATRLASAMDVEASAMASAADVRRAVERQNANVGLLFPTDLDRALQSGEQPTITVVRRVVQNADTRVLVAALGPMLDEMAGTPAPALITEDVQPAAATGFVGVLERLGPFSLLTVLAILMMIALIGTMIVPALLHEEVDKKTLSALLLVGTPGEVVVGKGLTGLIYGAVLIPAALATSGLQPAEPAVVAAALVLLALWVVEVGLVFGLALDRRTYETTGPVVMLVVLLVPAFAGVVIGSGGLGIAMMVWPTVAGIWLVLDAASGVQLYTAGAWGVAVLVGWLSATYALLMMLLRHREF